MTRDSVFDFPALHQDVGNESEGSEDSAAEEIERERADKERAQLLGKAEPIFKLLKVTRILMSDHVGKVANLLQQVLDKIRRQDPFTGGELVVDSVEFVVALWFNKLPFLEVANALTPAVKFGEYQHWKDTKNFRLLMDYLHYVLFEAEREGQLRPPGITEGGKQIGRKGAFRPVYENPNAMLKLTEFTWLVVEHPSREEILLAEPDLEATLRGSLREAVVLGRMRHFVLLVDKYLQLLKTRSDGAEPLLTPLRLSFTDGQFNILLREVLERLWYEVDIDGDQHLSQGEARELLRVILGRPVLGSLMLDHLSLEVSHKPKGSYWQKFADKHGTSARCLVMAHVPETCAEMARDSPKVAESLWRMMDEDFDQWVTKEEFCHLFPTALQKVVIDVLKHKLMRKVEEQHPLDDSVRSSRSSRGSRRSIFDTLLSRDTHGEGCNSAMVSCKPQNCAKGSEALGEIVVTKPGEDGLVLDGDKGAVVQTNVPVAKRKGQPNDKRSCASCSARVQSFCE
eukprot:gnl/MRDRNA2_/MRDRNA2_55801_c0_seq1.p1 gnl/MRDRNA2_/MRDRNA2_55801_c0~~gnl/MRDRNA2_/MRDRNA2_55801_c0_seq1.p1  ORF type:complete len:512 (-),score=92.80 gnl/MRDRNA2_/MRDRNA2_55801_c0_seq1:175-1710(-)